MREIFNLMQMSIFHHFLKLFYFAEFFFFFYERERKTLKPKNLSISILYNSKDLKDPFLIELLYLQYFFIRERQPDLDILTNHFTSLTVHRSTRFLQFRNVDRSILRLKNCAAFGRVLGLR